ncbi:MAG: T9SS type A sorting domain-containing protein [Prolixibacteraceae bacterium]|nr:T9SS type A sorting domain-containing protein [Prolixibacteraceae bacterium]
MSIILKFASWVNYDDEKLYLQAVSTSGLVVRYEVSDYSVAEIDGDTLFIKEAGDVSVVAYQDGDENWMPATPVEQNLIIEKASQIITTTLADSITTHQHISQNDFIASSGLSEFEIESSDNNVIRVTGDSISVNNRGTVVLAVTQPGSDNYLEATEMFEFHVSYPVNVEKFENITLDLFPNPVDDRLHLVIDGDVELPLDFSLLNLLGQVQMTKKITKQFQVVDIERIKSGTYIVLLKNDDHYLTQKLIVK